MTNRVWLASYPKSGNTWFRMLLGCLSLEEKSAQALDDAIHLSGLCAARWPFDNLTMIESGVLTHDEIERLRPRVYEHLDVELRQADDDPVDDEPIRFVKAHDAYTLNSLGEPLLAGARGAMGAILIVRDPRDIVHSLANHNRSTPDQTITFMAQSDAGSGRGVSGQDLNLRQRFLDWSGHAASWLDQRDIPVHLVRYEDLKRDTVDVFMAAMAFAGRPVERGEVERAADLCAFSRLQGLEREGGFYEKPPNVPTFFRQGEVGRWRQELALEQVERIETAHGPMMQRLGYSLSLPASPSPSPATASL